MNKPVFFTFSALVFLVAGVSGFVSARVIDADPFHRQVITIDHQERIGAIRQIVNTPPAVVLEYRHVFFPSETFKIRFAITPETKLNGSTENVVQRLQSLESEQIRLAFSETPNQYVAIWMTTDLNK